jgi:endonuclease YncB( thermonuclease family)
MKNAHFNLALFMVATILSVLFAAQVHAEILNGTVVGVADGDTVTVLDASRQQYKIRLMGIDAPEKKQAFGNKSKQALSDLVFNKQVSVEFNKTDKYGRTIGKILVDGLDANLEQVKKGMAWHYKQYQKEQSSVDRTAYAKAEELAKAEKLGLWFDPSPTPPWDFRRNR